MLCKMKKIMLAGALMIAAMLSLSAHAVAEVGTRTFTVFNKTHYRIDHLYVSSSNYRYWGTDRLGNDVFPPNYRFDLVVTPGWYDVKLVDQDNDSCVVPNVDFRDGGTWTITDDLLVACELFSQN